MSSSEFKVTEHTKHSEVPKGNLGRRSEYGKVVTIDPLLSEEEFKTQKDMAVRVAELKGMMVPILEQLVELKKIVAEFHQVCDHFNKHLEESKREDVTKALNHLSKIKAAKKTDIETADATDAAETMALVNELKAKLNDMNS